MRRPLDHRSLQPSGAAGVRENGDSSDARGRVADSTATFTYRRCELDSRGSGCEQRHAGGATRPGLGNPFTSGRKGLLRRVIQKVKVLA